MIQRAKKRILAAALTLALLLTRTVLYAQAETAEPEGNLSDGGGIASTIMNPDEQEQSEPDSGDPDEPGESGPDENGPDEPGGNGPANRAPTATATTLGYSSIVAFAPLPEDVAEQEVTTGTQLADLDLPDALAATVEDEDGDQEQGDIPVARWSAAPYYDPDTIGTYTFTPELAAGYTLADGVELPEITVRVVMGIMPLATEIASGTCGANLTWSLDSDGVLTISGTGGMTNYANITSVPWSNYRSDITAINIGNGVTSICDNAFYNCYNFANISIPNSVTSIGRYAFQYCTSLASVTIGNSVTSIGNSAFDSCTSLASVTIGNSVTSIGNGCFAYCTSLASVTIPNSVTSIGGGAFGDCTSLESITIPDNVTSIDVQTFQNCTSLESVTIPNSVTSIGNYAFNGCTNLESVTIPNSVTSIGNYAFNGCSSLESVTIPDGVTSIGIYTFDGCTSLKNIVISNNVTSIGMLAFSNCISLQSIVIPNNVTSIDGAAFRDCTSLTSVTFQGTTPPTIPANTFDNVPTNGTVYYPEGASMYNITWLGGINGLSGWTLAGLYPVTIHQATGGTVTPDKSEAPAGAAVTLTVNTDSDYNLKEWNTTPSSLHITGSGSTYTFTMPSEQVSIEPVFEQVYTITIHQATGGTVTPDKAEAPAGAVVTLTVNTDSDYILKEWNTTPSSLHITGSGSTYTFTMPSEQVSIEPVFEQVYTITIHQATGGTVTPDKAEAPAGAVVTLTVNTDSDYILKEWNTTPSSLHITGSGSTYTFTMPSEQVSIEPVFEQVYTVAYDVNGGGGTAPGPFTVEAGQQHTIAQPGGMTPPDSGHRFKEWNTNSGGGGTPYEPGDSITPSADLTLYAIWEPIFTITASADANGSMNPSGYVTVADGGSQTFTITPDTGYEIADVLVDGGSVGAVASHTFSNVTANHTIHATFKQGTVPTVNAQTPSIGLQPVGGTYTQNASAAALTVTASVTDGGTLSYQWYSNTVGNTTGGTAVGGNSSSYTPATATVGTTYYYVVVTNTNSSATGRKTATATSIPVAVTVQSGGGNSGNTNSGGSGSSGNRRGSETPVPKTQLPASAFSWDGDRTLTIDHDGVTVLGLLSVRWNGQTLTPGTDFTAHQGSVILRFSQDIIAAQATGDHTVRVEFLSHYGETTVTVGAAGTSTAPAGGDSAVTGDTLNPNTGGGSTDNPQTGDFARSPWWWLLVLIPAAGAAVWITTARRRRTRGANT